MKLVIDANIFLNVIFNEEQYAKGSKLLLNAIEDNKFDAYICYNISRDIVGS
jgi:predicted nucleic acid-binding protein